MHIDKPVFGLLDGLKILSETLGGILTILETLIVLKHGQRRNVLEVNLLGLMTA